MQFLKGVIILIVCVALVYYGVNYTLKSAITPTEYLAQMQGLGYNTSEIYKNKNNIEKAYVAEKSDEHSTFDIEYIKFDDEESTLEYYEKLKQEAESLEGIAYDRAVKGLNYAQYVVESNAKYITISRIDNTIVYANVDSKVKTQVYEAVKDIGYWVMIKN